MFHLFEKIHKGEVYFIAEMSANHGGSLENALEIVRGAAKAGADCLKIQTYTADSLTIDCDNEYFQIKGTLWDGQKLYDLYKEAGTPYEWQAQIKEECEKCGVDFLSTPFDNAAVDFLDSIGSEAYKIASFELVDLPLIEYAASKGKPMIISCGMGSESEIYDAVEACRRVGNNQIVLLKCCSEYPANWEDMHLANIPDMIQKFGVPVGLSDHSEGSVAAVVGVSMGACVVEKHVKLEGVESADSAFSMTMEGFAEMVKAAKAAKTIAGKVQYGPTPGEEKLVSFRRSLFAVKDIKKGDTISAENVRSIRPSQGVKPKYFASINGREALTDIPFGTPITCDKVKIVPRIQINRLILDEIGKADTEFIVRLRNQPDVYPYFVNPKKLTVAEHLEWFYGSYQKNPYRFDWIARSQDGTPVGSYHLCLEDSETVEVSYLTAPEHYRRGFAQEAIKALMGFASECLGAKKAIAVIHVDNERSMRFIEKLGFEKISEDGNFVTYQRMI
ncbi:MAG: pseudaminic acid synthase [Acetatifactor sp.]|nr:pseudaminic acid synthase [Acetatifactor sp.]